jgi:DNA polymerase-3 subunit beta
MKFTCTKDNLYQALALVGSIAGKQAHLPILVNVLIRAQEAGVEILATNLELAIRVQVRAKVDVPGTFTVPAKTLTDYVHLLSDSQVEIELDGMELVVTGGQSSTKIKGTPGEEFPILPQVEDGTPYVMSANTLKDGLEKTVIAVAKNEIRPELSGVYFGLFTDRYSGLILAATDSYRLAEKRVAVIQGQEPFSCIVPSRTVFEIIRLLSITKGE